MALFLTTRTVLFSFIWRGSLCFYFISVWFLWKQLAAYSLATALLLKKLLCKNIIYAQKAKLVFTLSPSERNAHFRVALSSLGKSGLWAMATCGIVEKNHHRNNHPKTVLKGFENKDRAIIKSEELDIIL